MELVFFALSLWLYLMAAVAFVVHLIAMRDVTRRVALSVLTLGFGCHAVALLIRGATIMAATSFYDQVNLVAWFIVGVYLLLQMRYNVMVVGALTSSLAFLLTLSAYMAYSGVEKLPRELQSVWLPVHVAPSFLGYAIFAVAFCVSVIYLVQEKLLKGKRHRGLFRRLPSLASLDELNNRFVTWGFAVFTFGILTGALLAKIRWGAFFKVEPVQILSILTWLLYAIQIHARSSGWRGRRAATLTIVGFVLILASFIGLGAGWHSDSPK
jgi:cytochrome c-type biogenesis protein CcsB